MALLCVVGFVASCSRAAPPRGIDAPSNLSVILITIDTLRADHVGVYGDRAETPNLDRFASQGVVFGRCIAQTPLTLPSHATILSGTYPAYHRVRNNGGFVVPDNLELVSETLRDRGFKTAAFVGAYVLDSKWGLDQGFDRYDDDLERTRHETLLLQNSRRAEEVIGPAEQWLRAKAGGRFFAWIHLFDPHTPYEPPPPFDRYPTDPYRGEVESTDHALGGLFDFLEAEGLVERCLVIVVSDHGESLGEHGEKEHGFFLYEPAVWVPLIMRAPVEPQIARWDGLVELVDIAPTILEAAGVPPPETVQGESLWSILLGGEASNDAFAYTETFLPRIHYGWSELEAVYQGGFKYISAPRSELYDLAADPEERINLADDPLHADRRAEMEELLERSLESWSAGAVGAVQVALSREDAAALRALGYITTTTTTGEGPLADPKDKVGVFNRLADSAGLRDAGFHDRAIAIVREIISEEPQLVEAHYALGNSLRAAGRHREAVESYGRALELQPDLNFAMIAFMSSLLDLGAADEAVRAGEEYLAVFPDDPLLLEQVAYAYAYSGQPDRALEYFSRSIAIEPNAKRLTKAGELYGLEGDYAAAEASLERALAIDPGFPQTRFFLAQVAESRGDAGRALELYREELEIDPESFRSAFRIAVILRSQGRVDEAIRYCRRAIEANPRFSLPYFMIAEHSLQTGRDLDEAIELCRRGLEVAPEDRAALAGYQVLLALLERTGDRESLRVYAERAEALRRKLEVEQ